jgi:hypothetical protein
MLVAYVALTLLHDNQERRIRKTDLILEQLVENWPSFLSSEQRPVLEDEDTRACVKLYVALLKYTDEEVLQQTSAVKRPGGTIALKDLLSNLEA